MDKRKRRAVAYVRVSSASKAQLHSYEYQEQYWRGKFIDDPDTELVGIYADKGISGSSIQRRPQFLLMMQDARDGKFYVVYTKSVCRTEHTVPSESVSAFSAGRCRPSGSRRSGTRRCR